MINYICRINMINELCKLHTYLFAEDGRVRFPMEGLLVYPEKWLEAVKIGICLLNIFGR